MYDDNVFNTNTDKKHDLSTVITPGVQLIFPRVKRKINFKFLYRSDIERFSHYTSGNAVNHRVEGEVKAAFPGGLSINLSEQFVRNHDPWGVTIGTELDFYRTNLASASVSYELSDRFKLQTDYSYYIVDYDAERNAFRNRADNTISGYLYYRFLPRTSAFIQYEYVLVDYKVASDSNSREQHFFGGITWDITAKSKGTVKAGYEQKRFNDPALGAFRGLILQASIDHKFNTKRSIMIKAERQTNESNIAGSSYFTTTGFEVEYFDRFTAKLTGFVNTAYGRDIFNGDITIGTETKQRKEDTWRAGLGMDYQLQKWLRAEFEYKYTTRHSSFDVFNYNSNTFLLRLTTTL